MKTFIVAICLLLPAVSWAQDNYFYLNLDINTPTANTSWLNSTSNAGGRAGYRVFLGEGRYSVGVDVNWATYSQYFPTETIQYPTGALTTDYYHYIYNYGIAGSGQYNFLVGDGDRIIPYAGLGLGANYNRYSMYYNIYEDTDKSWGFLVRPEAGILYRLKARRSLGVMAGVHYDYSTNSSDVFQYQNFAAFGVQLGIVLMSR